MHQEAYLKIPASGFHLLEDACVGPEFDQSHLRMSIPLLAFPDFCWVVAVDEVPAHHRLVVFADLGSISMQRKPRLPVGLKKHQEVCPRLED
jgi:hypothetical protein